MRHPRFLLPLLVALVLPCCLSAQVKTTEPKQPAQQHAPASPEDRLKQVAANLKQRQHELGERIQQEYTRLRQVVDRVVQDLGEQLKDVPSEVKDLDARFRPLLTKLRDELVSLDAKTVEEIGHHVRTTFIQLSRINLQLGDIARSHEEVATTEFWRAFWKAEQDLHQKLAAANQHRAQTVALEIRNLQDKAAEAQVAGQAVDFSLLTLDAILLEERAAQLWSEYRKTMEVAVQQAVRVLDDFTKAIRQLHATPDS